MIEGVITAILLALATGWLGSIEYRIRQMNQDLKQKPSREEMREYVILNDEVIKIQKSEIKDDTQRIEKKVDRLLEMNNK